MAHPRGQSEQENLNKGFIDPAQALGVVVKGFDGTNYPALNVTPEGNLKVDVDMATEGIATEATLAKTAKMIMGGPIEDTGYLYIGYKEPDGTYYIKRQSTTTYLWTYTYFPTDFATNWTGKTGLTYGEPV
jgi:hypothetical protein